MNDLATARADFLKRVESHASGQSVRFAPVLDEMIAWSEANGLEFTPHAGSHDLVKFSTPGAKMAFWTVTPRAGDGAKLTVFSDPRFPESLRTIARDELSRIDGKTSTANAAPELSFTKLIWKPYRGQVLDLLDRLLDGLRQLDSSSKAS